MSPEMLKQHWDRVVAVAAAIVGTVALILGWVGVSSSSLITKQIPYLASGAVVGIIAFGVATTMWLSADLRDEWAKLDDIYRLLDNQTDVVDNDLDPVGLLPMDGPPARRPVRAKR